MQPSVSGQSITVRIAMCALTALTAPLAAAQGAIDGATTKALFALERHEGASPDKFTANLRRQLAADEDVKRCIAQKGMSNGSAAAGIKRDWFVVYRMDLNSDGRDDWIVKSRNACLMGANVGAWWVYQDTAQGQQRLLKTHALSLEVRQTVSDGFSDLQSHRISGDGKDSGEAFRFSAAQKSYAPVAGK
jgi:hypothetical protein